jgi:hypothetical protein
MRQPAEIKTRPLAQRSMSTSLPAPIGGLNARDSVANMETTDAVALENWFPKTTSVDIRGGYQSWNTFTGVCQSILVYSGVSQTKIFPCVKNGSTFSIYSSTSSGALTVPVVGGAGATVEALTGTRFDYINCGTTGGQFLTVVNGLDVPLQYDGTTWIASVMTGGTPATYFTVAMFARRRWYGVKDSMTVYYSSVDTITGANTALPLGALFKLGGSLSSIITVTDASNTLTDYIGFLSTEGEVVAFAGTDPSSASTWTQAAHFRIGRPVIKGNRAWQKWGSDALVLCADGVYPIRKAINADSFSGGLAVSDKIRNLINRDLAIHGARYGWQVMVHPTGSKLIVNVPTSEDISSYQYVMNTETGAWTKYTGWTAFCFEVARDTLYFGGSGVMVKADTTANDGTAIITAVGQQAYNYFNSRGQLKHMRMLRPILASDGVFEIAIGVDTDYKNNANLVYREISGGGGDPWGGIWDVVWSGAMAAQLGWYGVAGIGRSIAPHLNAKADGVSVSWSATDALFELGGVIG